MRRREFIGLLGGATAGFTWPLSIRAQQPARVPRIGVLMGLPENDPAGQAEVDALQQALSRRGWTAGRNVAIDYRWPGNDVERVRALAGELVGANPDVLLARSTPATAALLRETRTIPIVFVQVSEPVGSGFVQSLARPGGNVTGFTNFESSIGGKWLELLKQVSPQLSRVAIMFNPRTAPYADLFVRSAALAAPTLGIEMITASVQGRDEIEQAIGAMARAPNGGLVCIPDTSNTANRDLIVAAAARHRLPAVYAFSDFARAGGLMVYAVDTTDLFRRAAVYVDRILKGEKPADLPVQQPTKFALAINLNAAKALGLEVPATLLAIADEVIE